MNQTKYHRISILGCGWLGFPLAGRLLEQGHFVRGSTMTKEKIPMLEEAGIEPYFLRLDPHINGDDVTSFFDVDTVVLSIPPPGVDNRIRFMLQQSNELISYMNASAAKRLVMISSTGVYGFRGQDADENDPHPPKTENGKGLIAMERQLMDGLHASVTVVRMAGLIGPGRHPGRFLSGRQSSSGRIDSREKEISGDGSEPVNLIHIRDATGVIMALIKRPELTGIYNACCQAHPTRQVFYARAAEMLGFEPPRFADDKPRPWKRIISEKIRNDTGYVFVYDNPADALKDL